jgi:hypothetical protein
VGAHTLLAASGEYSDFQYIMDLLQELVLSEHVRDDDAKITASEVRRRRRRARACFQRCQPFYLFPVRLRCGVLPPPPLTRLGVLLACVLRRSSRTSRA